MRCSFYGRHTYFTTETKTDMFRKPVFSKKMFEIFCRTSQVWDGQKCFFFLSEFVRLINVLKKWIHKNCTISQKSDKNTFSNFLSKKQLSAKMCSFVFSKRVVVFRSCRFFTKHILRKLRFFFLKSFFYTNWFFLFPWQLKSSMNTKFQKVLLERRHWGWYTSEIPWKPSKKHVNPQKKMDLKLCFFWGGGL